MYVYNTDMDNCREVLITPNCSWGGEGRYCEYHRHEVYWCLRKTLAAFTLLISTFPLEHVLSTPAMSHFLHRSSVLSLGCNIGYGYLHRVPRLLSGDGRRTRFPAHTSFRTPSEGLTKVGWVQQEKGSHGGPMMSHTILCSSGSSLCRHPNRSTSSVCRTTSHLFRPNRFSHLFISFTVFFFCPCKPNMRMGFVLFQFWPSRPPSA